MISKALIKHITSLHQGKFRDLHGQFIAEGVKIVEELLHSKFRPRYLCALKDWLNENEHLVHGLTAEIIEVNGKELERLSTLTSPNSVLAVFNKTVDEGEIASLENELILALEDIRDPGNLGTIVRIADWFGIDKIVCSLSSVDIYNPKTVQATMGSIVRVKVHYRELTSFIDSVSSVAVGIFAAALEGEDIYSTKLPQGGIVLIGNESHGLSAQLLQKANRKLFIPSFLHTAGTQGHAESLNASVATAIICSEFRRNNKS